MTAAQQANSGDPKRSHVKPFGGIDLPIASVSINTDHSHDNDQQHIASATPIYSVNAARRSMRSENASRLRVRRILGQTL